MVNLKKLLVDYFEKNIYITIFFYSVCGFKALVTMVVVFGYEERMDFTIFGTIQVLLTTHSLAFFY